MLTMMSQFWRYGLIKHKKKLIFLKTNKQKNLHKNMLSWVGKKLPNKNCKNYKICNNFNKSLR